MLYHLFVAFGALAVFMAGWWLVQLLVRKSTPGVAEECDILEDKMGCHGCAKGDSCSKART